ncbi:MAG: EscU/YscU/HrcU family type III secretion system export apparatus switch protein [Lachnospiraceae bacterium]|nr:EscU/YscU/HrcU family type III secretion system export apparatus switch protein [Lachnospiraceae bacterium]
MSYLEEQKSKIAVALEYEPSEAAPKIIASGRGHVAEKIIEKAVEENVPLHRDDKLAGTLSKLEIGDAIPPELYEVVAEIFLFVDKVDKIKGKVNQTK